MVHRIIKGPLLSYLEKVKIKRVLNKKSDFTTNFGLPEGKNMKILDLGCGAGITSLAFSREGWDVYSIDINKIFLTVKKNAENKIQFLLASGEKIPLKKNSFDAIYSNSVIEHIPDDKVVIDEIYRVLKKGGVLFLSVPNIHNLSTAFKRTFGYKNPYTDKTHLREYDNKEIINMLKKKEFHIESISMKGFLPPIGNKEFHYLVILFNLGKVTDFLAKIWPNRALAIQIKVEK